VIKSRRVASTARRGASAGAEVAALSVGAERKAVPELVSSARSPRFTLAIRVGLPRRAHTLRLQRAGALRLRRTNADKQAVTKLRDSHSQPTD
jgi:hypothetical protein